MWGIVIGGVIGAVIQHLAFRVHYQQTKFERIEDFKTEVRYCLRDAVKNTHAANAVLFHVHNGGGKLLAGVRVKSSCIAETPDDALISIYDEWQDHLLDESYLEMLRKVQSRGWTYLETTKMEGELRRIYEAKGIEGSLKFWVYDRTDGGPYYLSFPTRKKIDDLLGTDDFYKLERTKNLIQRLCARAHRHRILH